MSVQKAVCVKKLNGRVSMSSVGTANIIQSNHNCSPIQTPNGYSISQACSIEASLLRKAPTTLEILS